MNTVVLTPNDKTWDDVTGDEELQQLLFALFEAQSSEETQSTARKVQDWLADNLLGCAAEIMAATRIDQAVYCDNPVAPGHGEYCKDHEELD